MGAIDNSQAALGSFRGLRAVDTHAHLDFAQFDPDRERLIKELAEEGVGVINIATTIESNQVVARLAAEHTHLWAAVGIHPTDVSPELLTRLPAQIEELKRLIEANPKVVAVGEVGLDYYREKDRLTADTQKAVLRQFLTFALEQSLPVIFHCRDAYGDLLTMFADYPGLKGVIHCFTGEPEEAQRFLDLGFHLSFTATVTYAANETQRQTLSVTPLDRMMLETDSPFLSPQTRRGQRNDPRTIFEVAQTIAKAKDISVDDVLSRTTTNAIDFFKLEDAKG